MHEDNIDVHKSPLRFQPNTWRALDGIVSMSVGSSDKSQWGFLYSHILYIQFTNIYNKMCMICIEKKILYTELMGSGIADASQPKGHSTESADFPCMENARRSAVFLSCSLQSLMISAVWLIRQLSGLYRDWTRRSRYNGFEYSHDRWMRRCSEFSKLQSHKSAELCKVIKEGIFILIWLHKPCRAELLSPVGRW